MTERWVHVEFAKWGGRRHWTYDAIRLGEDEHGIWLGGPAGTEMDRPDQRLVLDFPSAVLVPHGRPWVAAFNADAPQARRIGYEVYIDVSTVPHWDGDTMTACDLDLDVVRRWDGTVEVLDEEEFSDHQVSLGYPAEVIAQAEGSAQECHDLLMRGAEPFVSTFRTWLGRVSADPEL
jgi:protein associated with RNAse G/E